MQKKDEFQNKQEEVRLRDQTKNPKMMKVREKCKNNIYYYTVLFYF